MLDALLVSVEPHATFHDAVLLALVVADGRLVAELDVCVGDPSAADKATRELRRRGRLIVDGLRVWATVPPDLPRVGSWLTSYGALSASPTAAGRALAGGVRPGEVGWFLYFSDANAFGYVVGERATFDWV